MSGCTGLSLSVIAKAALGEVRSPDDLPVFGRRRRHVGLADQHLAHPDLLR